MPVKLHAQHQEDAVLRNLFPNLKTGYYVDIGANDPTFCSVTKYFYDLGWRGINVEPVPHLASRLRSVREKDLTLNLGISNQSGSMTLYECPLIHGWSTFVKPLADVYRSRGLPMIARVIPVITLTELFESYIDQPVDFLKVDVEGNEREVLLGTDWTLCRPRVLVIENAWPESWSHLIPASLYTLIHSDKFNRYYVRNDEKTNVYLNANPLMLDEEFLSLTSDEELVYPNYSTYAVARIAGLASRDDLHWFGRSIR